MIETWLAPLLAWLGLPLIGLFVLILIIVVLIKL